MNWLCTPQDVVNQVLAATEAVICVLGRSFKCLAYPLAPVKGPDQNKNNLVLSMSPDTRNQCEAALISVDGHQSQFSSIVMAVPRAQFVVKYFNFCHVVSAECMHTVYYLIFSCFFSGGIHVVLVFQTVFRLRAINLCLKLILKKRVAVEITHEPQNFSKA